MAEELIELVDDNDQVTGTILRSEANAQNLLNFRAIYAWIVNSKGELYVPTRADHKKLYPGGYDFSVSGQVDIGENYEEAFARETLEELKFKVSDYPWHEVAKLTPKQLLMNIYHGHYFKPDIPMTLRMFYDYTK